MSYECCSKCHGTGESRSAAAPSGTASGQDSTLERDLLIRSFAAMMSGLAAPISLGVPLGAAREPWSDLHTQLIGVGWATPQQYEAAIRRVLDQ
jgi:hypothetical protein